MSTLFNYELNRACPARFPGEARESNQPNEGDGLRARKEVLSNAKGNLATAVADHFLSMGDTCAKALAIERTGIDEHQPNVQSRYKFTFDGTRARVPGYRGPPPIFKMTRNSAMRLEKVGELFDPPDTRDDSGAPVWDPCLLSALCLITSPNVHAEVYTYDDVTQQGSVTLFKWFGPSKTAHMCLTVPFYKSHNGIRWMRDEDESQLNLAEQVTLNAFFQQTMHYQHDRSLWPIDTSYGAACATRARVENGILELLQIEACASGHASATTMYVTSPDWMETPVFRRLYLDEAHLSYDILCRTPGTHKWYSLDEAIRQRLANEQKLTFVGRFEREVKFVLG
jgi:hypothetical protein